jgi:hypothetical protein
MRIVNLRLLSHPINYVTILAMIALPAIAGHLLLVLAGQDPGSREQKTSAWTAMPAGQAPGEERAGAISPQSAPIAINSVR